MTNVFKTLFLLIVVTQSVACFDLTLSDRDGDGVADNIDDFPDNPEHWIDWDGDGISDKIDAFPKDSTEQYDSDGDGVGDVKDQLDDNPDEWKDSDNDGYGDDYESLYSAEAGEDITTVTGIAVNLSAHMSTSPDDIPLEFEWIFSDIPIASEVQPSLNDEVDTSFTPDVIGEYELYLQTNHTLLKTRVDSLTVTVLPDYEISYSPALSQQNIDICQQIDDIEGWQFSDCKLTAPVDGKLKLRFVNNRPDTNYEITQAQVEFENETQIISFAADELLIYEQNNTTQELELQHSGLIKSVKIYLANLSEPIDVNLSEFTF